MDKEQTIVITGAAGFIGSCLVSFLNEAGYTQLVLADDFSDQDKSPNLSRRQFIHKIHRDQLESWCREHPGGIQYFFHLGARTDTTEQDYEVLKKLNPDYSKWVWNYCAENNIPLVYASSAATYGSGAWGYKDEESIIPKLRPLNAYGISKNEFDIWALRQNKQPPFWAGLKFFNVYGPNEYHKGRMASVIFHAFNQIQKEGRVKLFRSHHPDYQDGGQLRDFIYVKDVLQVCVWLMKEQPASGIYNLGTGSARSFKDLARAVFQALQVPENIEYIDTPADIREKYQYFTQADMQKLRDAGYKAPFYGLEEGVSDYVKNYLVTGSRF
jgi:ADP-L-glycero-D-manno-heptose 6-epimerase